MVKKKWLQWKTCCYIRETACPFSCKKILFFQKVLFFHSVSLWPLNYGVIDIPVAHIYKLMNLLMLSFPVKIKRNTEAVKHKDVPSKLLHPQCNPYSHVDKTNRHDIIYIHIYTYFFFNVGFLSRTFTNNRTAGEGEGYLINSSLPLPPASRTLRH